MFKNIIIAGLLGGLTLMAWIFLINGIFGFRNQIDMKQVPNESQVYELLKNNIAEPGRYLVNPELNTSNTFPANEPVFSILYGGMGHEAAGGQSLFKLILAFIAATLGAWLLSLSSEKIISSFPRKVLFFTILGILIAVFTDLNNYGIGNYPLRDTIILGLNTIVTWTVAGLVIARRIKPKAKLP